MIIVTTNGYEVQVSPEDYRVLSAMRWSAIKRGPRKTMLYVQATRRWGAVSMHRFIMSPPPGMQVDHANGDTLDNRRENLRICTACENARNHKVNVDSKSGYRGVAPTTWPGRWRAVIHINGKQKALGCYGTPEEAALAFNRAAIQHHGEFARLNVIPAAMEDAPAPLPASRTKVN